MKTDAGDLALGFRQRDEANPADAEDTNSAASTKPEEKTLPPTQTRERAKFPTPLPDALRKPRPEEVMKAEAEILAREKEKLLEVD